MNSARCALRCIGAATLRCSSTVGRWVWCVALVSVCLPGVPAAQGLRHMPAYPQGFRPLEEEFVYHNPFASQSPAMLDLRTTLFREREEIDFEKRQITFSRVDELGFAVWVHHYPELSDYLLGRRRFTLYQGWHERMARTRRDAPDRRGLPTLEFVMPVQYPDWAQRILGKDPPRLTIDGQLKLTVGYERETYTQSNRTGTKGVIFEQENRFSVRGTIGRVIDINIRTDSEESFDVGNQLKNFKVEYKGEGNELEDEIIQEVTAGFTGFSMPGTDLSGYSESHEGLFGIRVKSRLGPLELTTIISHEQGEPEELRFSQRAGGTLSSFNESRILRYRYFWVDTVYKRQYLNRIAGGADTLDNLPRIEAIQLWAQVERRDVAGGDVNEVFRQARSDDGQTRLYKQLKRDWHYEVSPVDGWLRIDSGVTIDERTRLGLFAVFDDGENQWVKGDTTFTGDSVDNMPVMNNLWLLKNENPVPGDPSFGLEWRNVYRGPRGDLNESFKVVVKRIAEGTRDSTHEPGSKRLFSEILGLTDEDGEAIDRRLPGLSRSIPVFDTQRGILAFPPFRDAEIGMNAFANPQLDQVNSGDARNVNERIYTLSYRDFTQENLRDQYSVELSGVVEDRRTTFELGWGVMRNTERVRAGNLTLERYTDYTIDYDMGTLTLVSKRALAENDLRIEYQREALFVPEKKLFMGARGEVRLPFISNNAFAAASVLFQRATSRDDIPRIGHEPYRKLLLNVNTRLDWQPEWMTRLVDAIPGIRTQAKSRVDLDVEVAHSRMNPNTSDAGEAQIDDFEASRQVTPLGDSHRTWFRASPPVDILGQFSTRPPAWWDYWFNPHMNDEAHRVEREVIWNINRETLTSQDRFESLLKLIAHPAPPPSSDIHARYDAPWTGIMTYLSPGLVDRSKDQYLEFWVRANALRRDTTIVTRRMSGGDSVVTQSRFTKWGTDPASSAGILYVDLGVIAEDISLHGGPPTGSAQPATEDTSGRGLFNIETDDLGIDFLDDEDEFWVIPNAARDGWDTLRYGDERLPFPRDPSRDNYAYYGRDDLRNRSRVNGTQGDAEINRSPSTTDINGDGYLELHHQERFFRYAIDLDSLMHHQSSRFLDTTANRNPLGGFYRVRIPLNDSSLADMVRYSSAGGVAPSFREIRGVRLFWSDFDSTDAWKEKRLELSRIQFVGNQWLPRSVRSLDTVAASEAGFEVSVVNNEDDREYREHFVNASRLRELPFEVRYNTDRSLRREQALKIAFTNLAPGDTALAERWFGYHPFDFSMYNRIRMHVHSTVNHENDDVRVVLRFGSDSTTYYQVLSAPLSQGWRGNEIVCELGELTQLKLAYATMHGTQSDTINAVSADGRYAVRAGGRGTPSLARVSWIALGIVRGAGGAGAVSGDVWLNNLRVDGTRSLAGSAARFRLRTQWADFLGLASEVNYQDGDFRRMTDTQIRAGDSRLDGTVSADLRLDRFLPSHLGISVPLGARATTSVTRPQLAPQSDISLTRSDGNSDRLSDMAKDALEAALPLSFENNPTTLSEHYQTTRTTRSLNTSFDKSSVSENPLANLTLDRLSIDSRYNYEERLQHQGERPAGDADYVDVDKSKAVGGYLKYDLSPRRPPSWTKWRPFAKSDARWLGSRIKAWEFSLLPSTMRFDLADNVNFTDRFTRQARSDIDSRTRTLSMGHGLRFDYSPISPIIDLGYGVSVSRDFNEDLREGRQVDASFLADRVTRTDDEWGYYGVLYGENRRSQDASLAFKPQFVDWLTHRVSYRAGYTEGFSRDPDDRTTRLLDVSMDGTFGFESDLQFMDLFRNAARILENAQAAANLVEGARKGFDQVALRSIRFNYDAASNLRNHYLSSGFMQDSARVSPTEFFLFQLGLQRGEGGSATLENIVRGDYDDERAFGGMRFRDAHNDDPGQYSRDTRRGSRKYSFSSGFKIPGIDINVNTARIGWETGFSVTPDTSRSDTTRVIPDLRLGANTAFLNKLDFISSSFQRVNLTTSYNYKHQETETVTSGERTIRRSWMHQLSPLIRFDGTLRQPTIRISYSRSLDHTTEKGRTWDRTVTNRDNASLNYDIPQARTTREITILRWSIPVEGRVTTGVSFDHSQTRRYANVSAESDSLSGSSDDFPAGASPTSESRMIAIKPQLSYVFTSKISGRAVAEWTRTTSTTEAHRRYFQIAATADIRF